MTLKVLSKKADTAERSRQSEQNAEIEGVIYTCY